VLGGAAWPQRRSGRCPVASNLFLTEPGRLDVSYADADLWRSPRIIIRSIGDDPVARMEQGRLLEPEPCQRWSARARGHQQPRHFQSLVFNDRILLNPA